MHMPHNLIIVRNHKVRNIVIQASRCWYLEVLKRVTEEAIFQRTGGATLNFCDNKVNSCFVLANFHYGYWKDQELVQRMCTADRKWYTSDVLKIGIGEYSLTWLKHNNPRINLLGLRKRKVPHGHCSKLVVPNYCTCVLEWVLHFTVATGLLLRSLQRTTTINVIVIILSDMYIHVNTNLIHTEVKKPACHVLRIPMKMLQHVVVSFPGLTADWERVYTAGRS